MRNIKLTIEYDGTHLKGWQVQSQGNRTVQGQIEEALKIIFRKKSRLIGSGRTDSGVHATGQVANFKTVTSLTNTEIVKALNANLPEDIVIINAEDVSSDFHAQYSAKRKLYRYTILNRLVPCAQQRFFCLHIPYKLNLNLMRQEAKSLAGKHDFRSFMASDPYQDPKKIELKNTIRTISRLDIKKRKEYIYIEIESNGFLYKMVRNIVGTLLAIGRGRHAKGVMAQILKGRNRVLAGETAAAHGLCLVKVIY